MLYTHIDCWIQEGFRVSLPHRDLDCKGRFPSQCHCKTCKFVKVSWTKKLRGTDRVEKGHPK